MTFHGNKDVCIQCCWQSFSRLPPLRILQRGRNEESDVRWGLCALQASHLEHPGLRPAIQAPVHRVDSGPEAAVDLPEGEEAGRVRLYAHRRSVRASNAGHDPHYGPLCIRPCSDGELQTPLPCKHQLHGVLVCACACMCVCVCVCMCRYVYMHTCRLSNECMYVQLILLVNGKAMTSLYSICIAVLLYISTSIVSSASTSFVESAFGSFRVSTAHWCGVVYCYCYCW